MKTEQHPQLLSEHRFLVCPYCDGHVYFWGQRATGLISYAACIECNETIFFPASKKQPEPPPPPLSLEPDPPRCHACHKPLTRTRPSTVRIISSYRCLPCGRSRITVYDGPVTPPPTSSHPPATPPSVPYSDLTKPPH